MNCISHFKLEENCYLVYNSQYKIGDSFLGKAIIKIENYDKDYVKITLCSNNYVI